MNASNYLSKLLIIIFLFCFAFGFGFGFASAQNCYQKAELFGERYYYLFSDPVDIAVYQDLVYLLDQDKGTVFKFDKRGELLNSFLVGQARTFAIDPGGFIYIGDSVNREIRKYNENGRFVLKWGGKGRENGLFMTLYDIFIDHLGFIHVNDAGDCHIQTFNKEGGFIKRIGFVPFKGGAICVRRLVVDRKGNYYGRAQSDLKIIKISPKGKVLEEWSYKGLPLCLGNNDRLYATVNNKLAKLSLNGEVICQWGGEGEEIGWFKHPTKAAMTEDGVLYVLDSGNKRIQTFYFPDEEIAGEKFEVDFQKEKTYVKKAINLFNEGRLRSTIRELKTVIQEMPKNSTAYYYLGLCYTRKEKYDLALQAFEKALKLNPGLDDAYYQIGLIAEIQGNEEKALEYYEKCTRHNGQHSLAHYKAGLILFEKEDYDRSRRELEASFWYHEMLDSLSLYNVSMILGRSEAQALKKPLGSDYYSLDYLHDYLLAEKYRPYGSFVYNETLDFYHLFLKNETLLNKELHKAEKYLTKAIRANPKLPAAYLEIGEMYYNYFLLTMDLRYRTLAKQQFELAAKKWKELKTANDYSKCSKANYLLGLILLDEGKFRKAIEMLQQAEKLYIGNIFWISEVPPDWGELINFYLGVCYEQLGQNEKAIENYRKAIEAHFLHTSPYVRIGLIYYKSGQFEKAIHEWKAGGTAFIEKSYNKYSIAYLYHLISKAYIDLFKSQGKTIAKEVIDFAERSVEITEGKKAEFLVTLAELYYLNKNIDRAIMNMEKAISAEQDKDKREQMMQTLVLYQNQKVKKRSEH